MVRRRSVPLLACVAWLLVTPGSARAQMPDVSQMSGVPLASGEVPTGTISVRVVRGDLSNNVAGQTVELHGAGATQTAVTDENGRATFAGIAPGTEVHAMATVDRQRLESQSFVVPGSGGMRVILVARGGETGAPSQGGEAAADSRAQASAPPQPGAIALGSQSRFIVELADAAVDVYAVLDVVNAQRTPVQPSDPLVFEAPPGAVGLTVLQASSPQAKAEGSRVTVEGPFAPGTTSVQFAYQVPYSGRQVTVRQALPVALPQTSLMVRKVDGLTMASPQATSQREVPIEGQPYYVANGGAIPAGGVLEVSLSGLPYHSRVPRDLALALAVAIAGAGIWAATGVRVRGLESEPQKLEARREQLFAELLKLEEQHRAGRGDASRYQPRRRDLIAQLEQVYMRLDGLGAGRA